MRYRGAGAGAGGCPEGRAATPLGLAERVGVPPPTSRPRAPPQATPQETPRRPRRRRRRPARERAPPACSGRAWRPARPLGWVSRGPSPGPGCTTLPENKVSVRGKPVVSQQNVEVVSGKWCTEQGARARSGWQVDLLQPSRLGRQRRNLRNLRRHLDRHLPCNLRPHLGHLRRRLREPPQLIAQQRHLVRARC